MEVEIARLEGLEGDRAVAVEIEAHAIEIVAAAIDRQIGAPIIRDPFIDQAAALIDVSDPIGAAAERRRQGREVELVGGEISL